MVYLENVTKEFGGNQVLKGINLNIKDGEVYGLVGRNGAGKTTLLNIIAGISEVSSGICTVMSRDDIVGKNGTSGNNSVNVNAVDKAGSGKVRRGLSYLPDLPSFYDYLTIEEYVEYLLGTDYEGNLSDYLAALSKLGFKTTAKIKSLSRGNRQKLGIYVATMKNPGIVLLDEPTSALDPVGRREVMELIKQLKKGGTTVILSTHILSDLEVVCDRIGFLNEGHIANEFDLHSEDVRAVCDYEVVIGGVNVDDALIEDMGKQLPHFNVSKGFGIGTVVCRFSADNSASGTANNITSNTEDNKAGNLSGGSTPDSILAGDDIQRLFFDELSKLTYPVSSVKKVSFVNLEELMVEVLTKN